MCDGHDVLGVVETLWVSGRYVLLDIITPTGDKSSFPNVCLCFLVGFLDSFSDSSSSLTFWISGISTQHFYAGCWVDPENSFWIVYSQK